MSVPLEIRYLSTAENDLDDIFDYIIMDNPSAAVSMLEKFNHSISQLAFNPELGVVSKDDRLQKMGYRILIIGKYLVFYVVKANTVQIRRIIHGARPLVYNKTHELNSHNKESLTPPQAKTNP